MSAVWWLTLVCFVSIATAALRPRGTAPYSNSTWDSTSLLHNTLHPGATPTEYSLHGPTGQQAHPLTTGGHGLARPTGYANASYAWFLNGTDSNRTSVNNASCTVNVPGANLQWWYGATYWSPVGTFTDRAPGWNNDLGGYLTLLTNPDSGPFDVASAMSSEVAWSEVVTYDPEYDMIWTDYVPYTVRPAAATTSIVERRYHSNLPSGNVLPFSDIFSFMQSNSTEARVDVATNSNFTSFVTSATPFLYFTAYEVVANVGGTKTIETRFLAQPTAIEYSIENIENSVSASGTLPTDFLRHIPQSACSPGTIRGSVTVLVVVDLLYVYLPRLNPFLVHVESTVLGWEDDPAVIAQGTSDENVLLMTLDWGAGATESVRHPAPQDTAHPQLPVSTPSSNNNYPPGRAQPVGGDSSLGSSEGQPAGQPQSPNTIAAPRETIGTIGMDPLIVGPSSVVVVGSQTLQPGAPAVVIGGNTLSVATLATAIIINGRISPLPIVANPLSPSQTIAFLGGEPVVIGPSSVVAIGTRTLQPGGSPAVIAGTPVSLSPSGNAIIADGKVMLLPQVVFPAIAEQGEPGEVPPILTIGSSTFTANAATQFFIAPGQTLSPGGTATVNGQMVSLGKLAAYLVVAGATVLLPISPPPKTPSWPSIVLGGSTIFAQSSDDSGGQESPAKKARGPSFVISGQTLSPGHKITVDGTLVSLGSSGSFVVVNGITSSLADVYTDAFTNPPLITIGTETYTAAASGPTAFVIDGQTLTPGGTITVNGTTVYLAPKATELVYGSAGRSTTDVLFPATTTATLGTTESAASAGATAHTGDTPRATHTRGNAHSVRLQDLRWTVICISFTLVILLLL